MATAAAHELDNGHIIDEDGLCWCEPHVEKYKYRSLIIHRYEQ